MKILLTVLLLAPLLGKTDTYEKTLNEYDYGGLNCRQFIETDLDTEEKKNYTYCSFQNMKYQHITDLGSFIFMGEDEVDNAIEGLEKCVKYMDDEGYVIECKGTKICTYELFDEVFETECPNNDFTLHNGAIFINDDGKITFLSKSGALNLIDWLKRLEFK